MLPYLHPVSTDNGNPGTHPPDRGTGRRAEHTARRKSAEDKLIFLIGMKKEAGLGL
jgi:hypothetical protein